MLAISSSDFNKFGCPNCGCDIAIRGYVSGHGSALVICENCKLEYIILTDGLDISAIGTQNGPKTEYPKRIEHPRKDIPKWKYEWPDPRPEEGEYFSPRGVGYDLAGFVKSKAAGERIIELAKKVLNKSNIKSWLDYRPHEPKWIQVKFQKEEFDLETLCELTKDGILTEEILMDCKL